VVVERLLWLRPQHTKIALGGAELLLAAGFPLVVLDLGQPPDRDRPPSSAVEEAREASASCRAWPSVPPFALLRSLTAGTRTPARRASPAARRGSPSGTAAAGCRADRRSPRSRSARPSGTASGRGRAARGSPRGGRRSRRPRRARPCKRPRCRPRPAASWRRAISSASAVAPRPGLDVCRGCGVGRARWASPMSTGGEPSLTRSVTSGRST
jgi:hypothetical protein